MDQETLRRQHPGASTHDPSGAWARIRGAEAPLDTLDSSPTTTDLARNLSPFLPLKDMGNQGSTASGGSGASGVIPPPSAVENSIEGAWTPVGPTDNASTPAPREGQAAACAGTRLYVFGGVVSQPGGEPEEVNDLYCFDTGKGQGWGRGRGR